ncbi:AAA family ATPase [Chryseobacterium sp. YR221]|uniref:AAA family ATPase n=1 Tax=Chryseobacterium sp. YR221 TaxID=1500293 RepID=UPI0009D7AD8F|nr:ATP-binding protein [Chryseobacterium sp. YR221]SMC52077.1 hypothetical protein SAMN02787074_1739 [Chryseobacterium sp. YR221]
MLISFKFKNFLSYKDEVQLLMSSVKAFKELKKTNTFIKKDFELLKTAAIYGSNGGGKSNFIKAMGFMNKLIHNSFADSLKKQEDRFDYNLQFRLNSTSEKDPIEMEVVFIKNNIVYRYGFHINNNIITKEWLFQKKEVETRLFERHLDDFHINNNSFSEGNKYKKNINDNVLFLSYLAQNNAPVSSEIFEWFYGINATNALSNDNYEKLTKSLLKEDSKFRIWLSYAVKFLAISNVELDNENNILTYHNKFDNDNFIIESIPFNLDYNESQGTIKLVYLLGAIYHTLINNDILFIDELDSKLHPNLTKKIISFFHQFNNNSQFVFTLHDSNLLDRTVFRRDQIWFVDKNKFGSSELYSLSDFDSSVVRSTSDYRKKYLELTFGAADSIEISEQLINLIYDEAKS